MFTESAQVDFPGELWIELVPFLKNQLHDAELSAWAVWLPSHLPKDWTHKSAVAAGSTNVGVTLLTALFQGPYPSHYKIPRKLRLKTVRLERHKKVELQTYGRYAPVQLFKSL